MAGQGTHCGLPGTLKSPTAQAWHVMPEACVPFCAKPAAHVHVLLRMSQFAFESAHLQMAEPAAETSPPQEVHVLLPASAYGLAAHVLQEAAPGCA